MDRQPLTRATPAPRVTARRQDPPESRRPSLVAGALVAAVVGASVLVGCSSSGKSASGTASSALSVAASAGSALASAASQAGSALASAEARASEAVSAASSAISGIKGGLDAKGDVTVGAVTTGTDGKSLAQLTVTNHGEQSYQYVIQVNFTDGNGKVLDATATTVQDLAAGQSVQATARSHLTLSGPVKAEVANAVRY
ncbi:FxLYD domain-containing protein [Kitasatospora aureofaciens]|uniref:FxLYD domain-containing protein n=1 Tax=Kitasatospora aureofaciens TaxID=1894 RepID=UPI00068E12D0|nr:FxLYD domain-containing protein [Kitasatospora aureofaciens]HJD84612.1 FxLYD domain-containing protein [Kitasatospora aureofaciens]